MAARSVLILFVCLKIGFGYRLMDDDPDAILTWPAEFHLKAERLRLKTGTVEPMELWYSEYLNRSRIDYYGGQVKKYYSWNPDLDSVFVGTVFPVTTEEVRNHMLCAASVSKNNLHYLLPLPDKFVYAGQKEHEGRLVDVWEKNYVHLEKLWKEVTFYTVKDADCDVPVQLVVKAYLSEKSALLGHTITNYYSYSDTVEEDALDSSNDGCKLSMKLGDDFKNDVQHLHPSKESDLDFAFHSYKKYHKKNYGTEDEHEIRKTIFQQNWEMINHHNRQNLGYKLELNQFADVTEEEVTQSTGLLPPSLASPTHPFPHSDEEVKALAEDLPQDYDMRVEGIISPVKNQASCGSCWAFATTAAVEGALARANGGRILDLSEQSLVDCSWGFHNLGCKGGTMSMTFKYVMKHGIPMEEEYGPYLEQDGFCHADNMTMYSIRGFTAVTPHSTEALKVALQKYGPVSVSIHFNAKMIFYASGIFYDPDCNNGRVNHGVTVVGYGVRDGVDYWIIKNSYSEEWGEDGYLLISAADNNCFVLEDPVYPVV